MVAETRKVLSALTPSFRNSSSGSDSFKSHLFRIKNTGFFDFRAFLAISLSLESGYFEESMTTKITSADSIASSICSLIEASKSSVGSFRPAVSTKMKESSIVVDTLSRVVPSSRATIAIFLCAIRLRMLDFPAFVCPIKATIGRRLISPL